MNIYIHKHHIIPRHVGGSDDPSNLIELTIEDHAIAHRHLWKMYGRWQDKIAWLVLSGQIDMDEASRLASSNSFKGRKHTEEAKQKIKAANIGRKHTEEVKSRISNTLKGHDVSIETRRKQAIAAKETKNFTNHFHSAETKRIISDKLKGNKLSKETKDKISLALKGRKYKARK